MIEPTARQRQILQVAASGACNKQIARLLGVSEQTVKNHMIEIFGRLEARNRTHAVVLAWQKGWIK